MNHPKFKAVHQQVQEVIDLIGHKNNTLAQIKINNTRELLDALIDFTTDDADLIEISKYQILINQLEKSIAGK
ncbi:hypothetical protein KIH23_06375 [Flavobacterium sp. CYK-55]|uniref:hypothetical protein n=1 Tax=Flavobacterium sp. CYK-55 TaxID=2835529 RepID=UPI001BD02BCC|nr:hypothetical protein [Flavobacterium sp. CYK-55]MBS7786916.1 hypothetical protein [Flavobacterium sp. CYK-55]